MSPERNVQPPYWVIHPQGTQHFTTAELPLRALTSRGISPDDVRSIELRHWQFSVSADYGTGAIQINGQPFGHFANREALVPQRNSLEPLAWKRTHTALAPGGAHTRLRTLYAIGWKCESPTIARYVVFCPHSRRLWWGTE